MLLRRGSRGEEVKRLQERLQVDAGSAAGIFGPKTEAAVKAWQKSNGLLDDGIVNPDIWGRLFPSTPLITPNSNFNLDRLRGVIPDIVINQIAETAVKFNITNVLRLSHFLAQCAHESMDWRAVSENLGYSAAQLPKMWPSLFNATNAAQYAFKPEMIANRAYGNRMGNGPESSGDGWRFRGRGYIQLTGKNNYIQFDRFVDDDILTFPELVSQKYPLMSAAFFFNVNNIWVICDRGAGDDVVTSVTIKVNGGTHGLADRLAKFKKYYTLLTN